MPRYDIRCSNGHDAEILTHWEDRHVPCAVCGEPTERVWKSPASVNGDEIPGGIWIENLGHEPLYFDSKKAIRDEADRRGLRLTDKWAGEGDRHLTNWAAAIDRQTLENATILLSRGSRPSESSSPGSLQTLRTEIREIKSWSEVK